MDLSKENMDKTIYLYWLIIRAMFVCNPLDIINFGIGYILLLLNFEWVDCKILVFEVKKIVFLHLVWLDYKTLNLCDLIFFTIDFEFLIFMLKNWTESLEKKFDFHSLKTNFTGSKSSYETKWKPKLLIVLKKNWNKLMVSWSS